MSRVAVLGNPGSSTHAAILESIQDSHRHAAAHVDKILRGAGPAALPVEQPTKFMLVVDARTAKALGLSIPRSLLPRAGRVID